MSVVQGTVARMKNCDTQNLLPFPVLQIVDIKRIFVPFGPFQRYRVLLTDGSETMNALPANQLNAMIAGKTVGINSVVRLGNYSLLSMKTNLFVVILSMELVCNLPASLGVGGGGQPPQQQQQQQQYNQPPNVPPMGTNQPVYNNQAPYIVPSSSSSSSSSSSRYLPSDPYKQQPTRLVRFQEDDNVKSNKRAREAPCCPICYREFGEDRCIPVILTSCGHTTCKTCSEALTGRGRTIKCPTCRVVTNAASPLPKNFALIESIRETKNEKQHSPSDHPVASPKSVVDVVKDVVKMTAKELEEVHEKIAQEQFNRKTTNMMAAINISRAEWDVSTKTHKELEMSIKNFEAMAHSLRNKKSLNESEIRNVKKTIEQSVQELKNEYSKENQRRVSKNHAVRSTWVSQIPCPDMTRVIPTLPSGVSPHDGIVRQLAR
jgi:hypothetical protein